MSAPPTTTFYNKEAFANSRTTAKKQGDCALAVIQDDDSGSPSFRLGADMGP